MMESQACFHLLHKEIRLKITQKNKFLYFLKSPHNSKDGSNDHRPHNCNIRNPGTQVSFLFFRYVIMSKQQRNLSLRAPQNHPTHINLAILLNLPDF
jgi:hypothetical protein